MKTPLQMAEQYLAVWNETNASRRRVLIEAAFIADGRIRSVIGFLATVRL